MAPCAGSAKKQREGVDSCGSGAFGHVRAWTRACPMVRRVEDLDREIVRLLAADGRRSFTDLAKDTGLSVSAVHQRVRRLEKRGVLRGYGAIVNADEVGLPLLAFVSIKPIDPAAPDDAP